MIGLGRGEGFQFGPLSFSVHPGEIVALEDLHAGTAVLRIIAGFERDYLGSVWYRQQLLRPGATAVGWVSPSAPLLPWLSVADNVAFNSQATAYNTERYSRAIDALRMVGLETLEDLPAATLNAGETQRAAIARALYHHPGVLLFDQPDFDADPELPALLRALTRVLRIAVLLNTESDGAPIADRRIAIRREPLSFLNTRGH